jgi:hypothetical protein
MSLKSVALCLLVIASACASEPTPVAQTPLRRADELKMREPDGISRPGPSKLGSLQPVPINVKMAGDAAPAHRALDTSH